MKTTRRKLEDLRHKEQTPPGAEARNAGPDSAYLTPHALSRYPRPWWFRALRWCARLWYLSFLFYFGIVFPNLVTVVAQNGFDALGDPKAVAQALLLDRLLRVLVERPVIVVPVLILIAGMIALGRVAHKDAERERVAEEEADRRRRHEDVKGVAQEAGKEAGGKAGASAAITIFKNLGNLAPSPEPQNLDPQGPPFDQLPRAAHFTGRGEELERLLVQLRAGGTTSIVALRGLGGIGKTALAAEAIHYLREEGSFPDGIAVVSAQDQTNTVNVLRQALGRFDPQRRQPAATKPEELARAAERLLQGKKTLIVIDNVEPGLAIEQVVKPLTDAGSTVLLTARQELPVGVPLELDVLPQDQAIELFAQEYGAGSTRDLTESQRQAVGRIVTALGRHTLAIKLAANYASEAMQDVSILAEDLERPGNLISVPGVNLIYAKSASSLQPGARKLFAALGAFPTAEFGRDAAASLAGPLHVAEPQPLLDLLIRRALVSEAGKNRITNPDGPGYPIGSDTFNPPSGADVAQRSLPLAPGLGAAETSRLRLHPVLQAIAKEEFDQLDQSEREALYQELATYYASYTSQVERDALGSDEQNIEGSLEWALAAGQDELVARLCVGMQAYWRDYGRRRARERYLPEGLKAAEQLARRQRRGDAQVLLALLKLGNAQLKRLQGHLKEAEQISRGILPVFRKNGNQRAEGSALVLLGNIARDRGQLDAADRYLKEALALFLRPDVNDYLNAGLVQSFLGQVAQRASRLAEAERYLSDSLTTYEKINSQWGKGLALAQLGNVSLARGRFAEADDRYRQALAIHQALQSRRSEGVDLSALGQVALAFGRFKEAEEYYQQGLSIRRETGDRRGEAVDLTFLGQLERLRLRLNEADKYLQPALALWQDIGDPRGKGWALSELGQLALVRGQLGSAEDLFKKSLNVERDTTDAPVEIVNLQSLAHIAWRRAQPRQADEMLRRALALARDVGDRPKEGRVLQELAATQEGGNRRRAEELYRESLQIANELATPLDIAEAQQALGRFLASVGNQEEGHALLSAAIEGYARLGVPQEQMAREQARSLQRGD